jgi:flagellar biosynthetic protein FliQ
MTPESVMTLGRGALEMILMVSAPILIVTLVVGLAVAIFQAATQINDASLSFVPKLVATVLTFALAGGWMLTMLVDYTRRLIESLPTLIG